MPPHLPAPRPAPSRRTRAEAAAMAADFDLFARGAWPTVCERPMVYELPQYAIGLHLQAFSDGSLSKAAGHTVDTLVLAVPPGSSKSLYCSVIYPAWLWARDPGKTIITVSHTQLLTSRFAAKFRLLVESEWFRARWPQVRLSRDTRAKLSMRNTKLGERIGVSRGGSVTGSHADVIVVDDIIDASDASNISAVQAANEWHEEVLMSRWKDERQKLEVCIAQRLHVTDLPAVLMARGATALVLPAEHPGPPTPVWKDPRRPGDLLAPQRLPATALMGKRATLGSMAYAAQYEQSPVPASGGVVEQAWLEHTYTTPPSPMEIFVVCDTSHGENADSDPTGVLVVGRSASTLYLLDYLTGQWPFPEQVARLGATIAHWHPRLVYVEAAASGTPLVRTLRQKLPNVVGIPPKGSKLERLQAVTPFLEAGAVRFPTGGAWVQAFKSEVLCFPRAPHDECVDVLSMACSQLLRPPDLASTTEAGVSSLLTALMG